MGKRISLWLWIALGLLTASLVLIFTIGGQKAYIIKTPSMGQTAPVGSLVLSRAQSEYRVGDVINFWQNERIYTHRIVGEDNKGFITKGDMNHSNDPWRVNPNDVIARADHIIHHAGWLLRALPWLIFGFILVYLISCWRRVAPNWRWPLRIMGGAIVVALVSFWLHPWLNFGLISYVPNSDKGVDMHIVNTGVFPLRAEGTRLVPGEDSVVTVPFSDESGRFVLMPQSSLDFWGIIFVLIFCLWPLIVSLFVRIPNQDEDSADLEGKNNQNIDKYPWIIIGLIVAVAVVILTIQVSSLATFTGTIINSQNTAATRSYLSCLDIYRNGQPKPYAAYGLYQVGPDPRAEVDISGNGRNGTHPRRIYDFNFMAGGACSSDTTIQKALNFNNRCLLVGGGSVNNPSTFSLEVWFRTTYKGTTSGPLVEFGDGTNTFGTNSDRRIYIDKDGRVVFGVKPTSAAEIVASPAGKNYADNQWHHVVVTFSSAGMKLYVDGQLVGQNASVTAAGNYTGFWKFGCGSVAFNVWKNGDGTSFSPNSYYNGQLQHVAIYTVALTDAQVREHYQIAAQ